MPRKNGRRRNRLVRLEGKISTQREKELFSADPDSQPKACRRPTPLSPVPFSSLPPPHVNKTASVDCISASSETSQGNNQKLIKPNNFTAPHNRPVAKPVSCQSTQHSVTLPVLSEKGDNMPRDTINSSGSKSGQAGDSEDKLSLVLQELKEIKQDMKLHGSKLDAIENTTASLAEQLSGVVSRTAKLEEAVTTNTEGIREINDQVSSLKATVSKQGSAISSIVTLKEDIQKSNLIELKSNVKVIEHAIMKEVDKKVAKIKEEMHCQSLKTQAFNNRLNLVVVGLKEESNKSALKLVKEFFTQTLKINGVGVAAAHRIGNKPDKDSTYARPLVVRFNTLPDRNLVWKNRVDITKEDGEQSKIRVLADLPKPLREGVQALYKVANAASKMEEYQSARVRNYQLEMNDEVYQITELEDLPMDLRPSTLAAPRSNTSLAFFSRHSFLSNHFVSDMQVDGRTFSCMEHYLAFQRAVLSDKKPIIKRARKAKDPLQAKHILHSLRDDHPEQWNNMLSEITVEGLREKFKNNQLRNYLCSTGDLRLGEASKNPTWGIGMDLSDDDVLDHTKWNKDGNLLGKSLMQVREELLTGGPPPSTKM